MLTVLGVAATAFGMVGAFAILMQARTMWTRRASCDVSMHFLWIYASGDAVWLAYGAVLASTVLVLTDAVSLVCSAITLGVAMMYHGGCATVTDEETETETQEETEES